MRRIRSRDRWVVSALCLAILVFAGAPGSVAAEPQSVITDLQRAFVGIAKNVSQSVVRVSSTRTIAAGGGEGLEPFRQFPFFPFPQTPRRGPRSFEMMLGSGFVVKPDGLIMTNNHVVKNMKVIHVTLPGNRDYVAKLVGADPESDVALIKVEAKNLSPIKWGDSAKLQVGDIVVAIGNPFGLTGSVTSGIVSAIGRSNVGIEGYEDFIQTDAPINPGNSGGPLVNVNSEVIGMNTAIASKSGGYMGIGFAIPSNAAKYVMDELLKYGKVKRGLLGINIQDLNPALAKSFGRTDTNGALVSKVLPDGPAANAGIKAGDIVLQYEGNRVDNASQLKFLVGQTQPGKAVKLTIWRDKKSIEVAVTLGERTAQIMAAQRGEESSKELGITVEKVPPAMASKLGIKESVGLSIKKVEPTAAGAAMGLKEGDVILEVDGSVVKSASEFAKLVAEAKKNGVIRMMIQRGSATLFLAESF